MDEEFKKKIKLLLFLLGGLFLSLIIFFLLSLYRQPASLSDSSDKKISSPSSNLNQIATSSDSTTVKKVVDKPVVNVPKKITKNDIEKMAMSFAERFGTYSNQADFSNMKDLKIFMSRSMQLWTDNYIAEQSKKNNDIYSGITTKAVVSEIKSFDNKSGKATVLVKTRRREATMTTSNVSKVFNQDITIDLIKENNAWKIDKAYWGK